LAVSLCGGPVEQGYAGGEDPVLCCTVLVEDAESPTGQPIRLARQLHFFGVNQHLEY
jgi:hypothetical protein